MLARLPARVQHQSLRVISRAMSSEGGREGVRDAVVSGSGAIVQTLKLSSPRSGNEQGSGILSNFTVAVKDSYDIAGLRTGNGSPDWLESHIAATATAPAVDKLLVAGARVVAKCTMDEMAYSIEGQNNHYGTPLNPSSPDRIPGGSSSGSASAVAQGLADIGLGGDTGGSIRIPASFCGLYGIRPTHGRVNITGSVPLAPSFDTGGWLTRDVDLLARVGEVLLEGPSVSLPTPVRWLVGTEAFDLCSKEVSNRLYDALSANIEKLRTFLSSPVETRVCEHGSSLADWFDVFRVYQGYEVWKTHGEWVQANNPTFGPGVKERFEMASKITMAEFAAVERRREIISAHLDALVADSILMIPTASDMAPLKGELSANELQQLRSRTLALTSIAGLGGLPQVTIPVPAIAGGPEAPIGLSLVGPRGSDEALLSLASKLSKILLREEL